MTITVIPTGFCNIDCAYCFEPQAVRKQAVRPALAAIEQTLDRLLDELGSEVPVGLHGGECTSIPLKDIEALLSMIASRKGHAAVQTNGYAISPELIRLFKQYNTLVSVSWDGPGELNGLRGPDPTDPVSTERFTERLSANVQRMREADLRVAITVVLSRVNAGSDEKLQRMKEWMLWLARLGISRGRMNPLFTNPPNSAMELTAGELAHAYISLFDFVVESGLEWLPYREAIDNLLGFPIATCIHAGCNPDDTFVHSIFPDGRVGNCDRTFQGGLTSRPVHPRPNSRLEILIFNHCAGCKFWRVCHGGCPAHTVGEGPGMKPRFCEADYALYEHAEKRLRSLLPTVRLITDRNGPGEPFEAMSWRAPDRPSSYLRPNGTVANPVVSSTDGKRLLPMAAPEDDRSHAKANRDGTVT